MNVGRLLSSRVGLSSAAIVTLVAIAVVGRSIDQTLLATAFGQALRQPARLAVALALFGVAFVLRAIAWRRVVPGLPFGHALSAIHLTLGANHLLPLRLGEPLRVASVVRRAGINVEVAAASTVTLRAADMLTVVLLGALVAPGAFLGLVGPLGLVLFALVALVAVFGWRWLARLAREQTGEGRKVVPPGVMTIALAATAWLAESALVWQSARWAGLDLRWSEAVLVTAVAVAAQVAAVAPGGFGTYEAAAVAAYTLLGHDPGSALVAALTAHGLKTAYSLGVAGIALVWPGPGFVGRLRLRGSDPLLPSAGGKAEIVELNDPVLFFMPAYNEEATVAACVRRVPSEVFGHPVHVLVIDDGSTDETADRARAAGAEVISLGINRGLGAAVRVGLSEAIARRAAATVFCDADGEYPPEELADLVGPILRNEADYVTGSRFLGRIGHMKPIRRIGNLVLTVLLSIVARRRITDGQTGYRALSRSATAGAEVIHDFNYAQVLTLDLLAKGYRHAEVPISYLFRTEGESFVKPGRYLRNVIPAVYRELNAG